MDELISALEGLGWDMRKPLNITFDNISITATPISSIETRWNICDQNTSHYFTSEIGPDEYDYVVDELSMLGL